MKNIIWRTIGTIILAILCIPAFKDMKAWYDNQQYYNTIKPNNVLLKESELDRNPKPNNKEWLISKAVCAEYKDDVKMALNYLYQIENPSNEIKEYIHELELKLK